MLTQANDALEFSDARVRIEAAHVQKFDRVSRNFDSETYLANLQKILAPENSGRNTGQILSVS
jgi:hypothetical protein